MCKGARVGTSRTGLLKSAGFAFLLSTNLATAHGVQAQFFTEDDPQEEAQDQAQPSATVQPAAPKKARALNRAVPPLIEESKPLASDSAASAKIGPKGGAENTASAGDMGGQGDGMPGSFGKGSPSGRRDDNGFSRKGRTAGYQGGTGGASARDVERGYDRDVSVPDNGNGDSGRVMAVKINSTGDGDLGAVGGKMNAMGSLGGDPNDNPTHDSSKPKGSNSGGMGIEVSPNSKGFGPGNRNIDRNSGSGPKCPQDPVADNTKASGSQASSGKGSTSRYTSHNSTGSISTEKNPSTDRERNQNQGRPNNSGYKPPNHEQDSTGSADSTTNDNDVNGNKNDASCGDGSSNREAGKTGAPDRPEEEGWEASPSPVTISGNRRRFQETSIGKADRSLLGEKRDAEDVDAEDGLRLINGRIDPLTGNAAVTAPSTGGVSPILRQIIEKTKKSKEKK